MLLRFAIPAFLALGLTFFATSEAAAQNRWVTIVNNTGYDMVEFYGSHRDATSWQEDILGSSILRAGYSVDVNFNDGTGYCMFDFRAVFEDGDVLVRKGINICEIGKFTYN